MTKADQIVELIEQGLDYSAVAERIGCRVEYVRAVKQRRITAVNRRNEQDRHKRATDPVWLERQRALRRASYHRCKKKSPATA